METVKNIMRVLLIDPPFQRLARLRNTYFPIGIGYVASALESKGHHVRIYNANKGKEEGDFITSSDKLAQIKSHDNYVKAIKDPNHYVWNEIRQRIQEFRPDIIGIQAMTASFPSARIVARISKEMDADVIVVIGGVHPTTVPDDVMTDENFDFAVCGEGEITTTALVEALAKKNTDFSCIEGICFRKDGGVKRTRQRGYISDLDSLPFPGRHLVFDKELYSREFGSLLMGRGCPFPCTFCASKVMWTRKTRSRSPANVVAEIKHVKENYGIRSFDFLDDTLTFSKKRLVELCNMLVEARLNIQWMSYSRVDVVTEDILPLLKKSGCYQLSFGVESGSERILKIMKKQINLDQVIKARELMKKYGIEFTALFMIGTPDEKKEDIVATIDFLKRLRPDSVNVCTYTPYPGTEMYDRAVQLGVVTKDMDPVNFSHHSDKNMFSKFMTPEEFIILRNEFLAVADSITNRMDWAYVKSMMGLLARDPKYFMRRLPLYIGGLPKHVWRALASHS